MSGPRSAQEFIHWLEVGAGRAVDSARGAARRHVCAVARSRGSSFTARYSELTLIQADTGRQLARGAGSRTLVNLPQTAATLQARGRASIRSGRIRNFITPPLLFDRPRRALRVLPEARRNALFAAPPVAAGWFSVRDYFLLGVSTSCCCGLRRGSR